MNRIFKLSLIISMVFLSGCTSEVDNRIERYSELLEKFKQESDFHSELYVFPEKIEKNKVLKFRTQHQEFPFTGSYLFFLVYQYEEDFEKEIERLQGIKADFKNGKSKSILHFEKKSLFVTISKDNRYEFVKYNSSTKQIAYISNQLYVWSEIDIDPLESIEIPKTKDDGENSYNMYYYYEGDIGYYVNDDFPKRARSDGYNSK